MTYIHFIGTKDKDLCLKIVQEIEDDFGVMYSWKFRKFFAWRSFAWWSFMFFYTKDQEEWVIDYLKGYIKKYNIAFVIDTQLINGLQTFVGTKKLWDDSYGKGYYEFKRVVLIDA